MKHAFKIKFRLFIFWAVLLSGTIQLIAEDSVKISVNQDSAAKHIHQLKFLLETLQENKDSGEKSLAPLLRMNIEMESLDSLLKRLPVPEKFQIGDEEFSLDATPLSSIFQKKHKELVERKGIVKFGGDVVVGRNELVKGDVVLFGGDAKIYGQIEGGIVSVFGNIKLASTSKVENEVVCIWGNTVTDEGATIHGETIIFNLGNLLKRDLSPKGIPGIIFTLRLLRFLFLILFAWIVYLAFPTAVHNVSLYLKNEYAKSMIYGLSGILLFPIAFLVLLATIIGIPVAVIALPLLTVAAFILGITGMARVVSEKTSTHFHIKISASFLTIFTGIIIIELPQILAKLFMILSPALGTFFLLLGVIVFFIAWMPAFGAVIATRFGKENLPPNK